MSNKADRVAKAKGTKATKRKRKKAAEIRQYGQYGKPLSRRTPEPRGPQVPDEFRELAATMGIMQPPPQQR